MSIAKIATLVILLSVSCWSWGAPNAAGATIDYQLCFDSSPSVAIKLEPRFCVGDERAPVVLTVYACGRSPICAKLIPALYQEVVARQLKGKVRLCYRPFFPGEQKDASACGRALVAAANQGMLWPYLLHLYSHEKDFTQCMLSKWADLKGLDRDAFEIAYNHPNTTETLIESRKEGIANKVDKIPSAFINGRKVQCDVSAETLRYLLEEEYERVTK